MKSEVKVDLRTPHTMAMVKRNNKEQFYIRQKNVRDAQEHGIKPTARHFGCINKFFSRYSDSFTKIIKTCFKKELL